MATNANKLLKKIPLFQNLSADEIEAIATLAIERIYPKGSHIFCQGEPIENVYFIVNGAIKIYWTDPKGREHIINILEAGEMFPHQGFFRRDDYPANAVTLEESILFFIPIKAFEQFLLKNPLICIKIFRILGDIIVELQNRLEEKALRNTKEQLILLLLRLAKKHGRPLEKGTFLIRTHFTNQELANMLGASRETVSRILTELKRKGIVSTNESGNLIIYVNQLRNQLEESV